MTKAAPMALALLLAVGLQGATAEEALDEGVLEFALSGYRQVVAAGEVEPGTVLTIIDYSRPSTEPRLFVYDPEHDEVLRTSLVAHGKNSGENRTTRFGNEPGSLRSSPGFFVTGDTYQGRHGYSLRLHGLEPGINDNAARRHIVIHGADYVSRDFARRYGRLGRSWGCPALPHETARDIIDVIKNGTCLFIYCDDPGYLHESSYIDPAVP